MLRRFATGMTVTAVTIAVVLLIAEVAIRWFGEVSPPLRVRDARIGERYVASFDEQVYSGESGRHVRLSFNAEGFRGGEVEAKAPGTKRIVVLGDSMVAALAVEEDETMVQRLEVELGAGWEALNFGVSASSPAQAFVLYREVVASLAPDVVVYAFFVGNDLSDSSPKLDHYPRIYFEVGADGALIEHLPSASRSRSSSWLNQNSRFYVWQKRKVNLALHASRETVAVLPPGWWIYAKDPTEDVAEAWAVVEATLGAFRAKVEADGARFVVVVLPSGRQIYPDRFEAVRAFDTSIDMAPQHADDRMRLACDAAGVSCLFLTEALEQAAGGVGADETDADRLLFFHGTGHFTPAGHALAARRLAEAIAQ